jgi:hypothetical protein
MAQVEQSPLRVPQALLTNREKRATCLLGDPTRRQRLGQPWNELSLSAHYPYSPTLIAEQWLFLETWEDPLGGSGISLYQFLTVADMTGTC